MLILRLTLLFFISCRLWCSVAAQSAVSAPLYPYVNPFIGTGGHGHTFPGATAPFGMVQLSPDTRISPTDWDGCSGYHYSDSLIYGFSHTHLSGTGVPDYCDILFMPFTGDAALESKDYAAPFRKSTEKAMAGYYAVTLDKDHIRAELTATERVGVHRYTFPKNRERAHMLIDLRHRDVTIASHMHVVNDREVEGYRISRSWGEEQHVYFVARFSRPFFNTKVLDMSRNPRVSERSGSGTALVGLLDFYHEGEPIVVTVGISGVSMDGARRNLVAECDHFDFDMVKTETQAKWEAQLSKIKISGGSQAQKTTFYTALYHTMTAPNLWNDVDGRYRGRDKQIRRADHNVYTVFSLWDTYRALNPLMTLIEPERTEDFIRTFLLQYREGGLLPVWELAANETNCMIGNHAIPVICDAWMKGIRGFDGKEALAAMIKSADQDRLGLAMYKTLGYIPSDQEPESASKTLEYAFDDWCVSRMAEALGDQGVAARFKRRALHYKNLYDPSTGFFRAKNNSTWYAPFDPYEVNFNYTEANAWQYRFATPQDIGGLMALLGGPSRLEAQIDALFSAQAKTSGRNQADITGLIGQYVQGNEPSHHMAYLYNYVGKPWKTQQRVRQILQEMYTDQPDGLSGNEDCGQMSAWYVMSAMGLYPVTPGRPQYALAAPLFEDISIALPEGKTFRIRTPGASDKKMYVQQARLGTATHPKAEILHEQIVKGGELSFETGESAGAWGADPAHWPVSAIEGVDLTPAPFVAKGERVFQNSQTIALGCADTRAAIYYTLDGSEPSPRSLRYKKPFKIRQTTRLRFFAQRDTLRSASAEAEFSKLDGRVKTVRYNTRYNTQYTGRGDQGIVDLLYGGADFRSGGWQGYEGVNFDVVLDLGKKQPIQGAFAHFLQDENSWIFLPTKVQFEISDDGVRFTPLGEAENPIPWSQKGTIQHTFRVKAPAGSAARYVRIAGLTLGMCPEEHKGKGYPCWIFTDEAGVE